MPIDIQETIRTLGDANAAVTDRRIKEQLQQVQTALGSYAQEQEAARNRIQAALNESQTTVAQLRSNVSGLQHQVSEQLRTIEDLNKKLAEAAVVTTATPLEVANSFKNVIDTLRQNALKSPDAATTIKSMDIEVKGLVQVQQDKTTLMAFPKPGSPVDAGALSTLRVSFATVPSLNPEKPEG